jgi:succinate-acetate transporter protein
MATISEEGLASGRQEGEATVTGWVPSNPAPLGLAGFGLTTLVLSFVNANIVGGGPASFPIVLGMAIAFGGSAQLLAGMWEFRTGNTFGAVAFTSYGAFWISFFFLVSFNVAELPKTEVLSALGLYLWAWGIFTGLLFVCTFKSPRTLSLRVTAGAVAVVPAADDHVHPAGYRQLGRLEQHHSCGRLLRHRHRGSRALHHDRRRHEGHVRPVGTANLSDDSARQCKATTET